MRFFIKMIEKFTEKELKMRTLECLNNANRSSLYYDVMRTKSYLLNAKENLRKYEEEYRPVMIRKKIDNSIYDKKVSTIKNRLNRNHSPKSWRQIKK